MTTKGVQDEFNGIGCFNGTFSLQVKPDRKPYQVSPRCIAYGLQWPFKEELKCLQQQDIIAPLGIDKTAEWHNSFQMVPKTKWESQAMSRSSKAKSTGNDIFPELNNVQYLSLIDACSGYYSLKLDERSSYLTTFACQTGRYRYRWLPFETAPTGDMFQRKVDKIYKDLPMYLTSLMAFWL